MINKIIENFKKNWINYGFETFTIIIGILGAFTLNNWNENRKQKIDDFVFLKNLKTEIQLDTANMHEHKKDYLEINNRILKSLTIIENSQSTTVSQDSVIGQSLRNVEVLTPLYKNISRNDIVLAEGTLNRIDTELNQKYISYIESMQYSNNIINKLGETLQIISIQDISPHVDLDYRIDENKKLNFNFNEIKTNRQVKNAMNKSVFYRRISISRLERQLEEAENLLFLIHKQLTNEK